jgi:Flp pilus assembly CpaF family ATPase
VSCKTSRTIGLRPNNNSRDPIKTNIGDSVNVVVQLERRPGKRFVSEVVQIIRYDPDLDEYDFGAVFQYPQETK